MYIIARTYREGSKRAFELLLKDPNIITKVEHLRGVELTDRNYIVVSMPVSQYFSEVMQSRMR